MNTIFIMAKALAEAAKTEITRLDIQYNWITESYSGVVWFRDLKVQYKVCEDGSIIKMNDKLN